VITWTTGASSGGNADDGLGGNPAQVSKAWRVEGEVGGHKQQVNIETNVKSCTKIPPQGQAKD